MFVCDDVVKSFWGGRKSTGWDEGGGGINRRHTVFPDRSLFASGISDEKIVLKLLALCLIKLNSKSHSVVDSFCVVFSITLTS